MAFALMAFAFMGSSSSNSSSGSPPTVIGKRPRASLVSALRQNRILALFATHVLRAGVALTSPLSASDWSGDSAAQNKCPLWADTVEKRFCGPECATLIQNRGRVRNFDSNTLLFGFDCCVWADR